VTTISAVSEGTLFLVAGYAISFSGVYCSTRTNQKPDKTIEPSREGAGFFDAHDPQPQKD
jgi:hypothetical protein